MKNQISIAEGESLNWREDGKNTPWLASEPLLQLVGPPHAWFLQSDGIVVAMFIDKNLMVVRHFRAADKCLRQREFDEGNLLYAGLPAEVIKCSSGVILFRDVDGVLNHPEFRHFDFNHGRSPLRTPWKSGRLIFRGGHSGYEGLDDGVMIGRNIFNYERDLLRHSSRRFYLFKAGATGDNAVNATSWDDGRVLFETEYHHFRAGGKRLIVGSNRDFRLVYDASALDRSNMKSNANLLFRGEPFGTLDDVGVMSSGLVVMHKANFPFHEIRLFRPGIAKEGVDTPLASGRLLYRGSVLGGYSFFGDAMALLRCNCDVYEFRRFTDRGDIVAPPDGAEIVW